MTIDLSSRPILAAALPRGHEPTTGGAGQTTQDLRQRNEASGPGSMIGENPWGHDPEKSQGGLR